MNLAASLTDQKIGIIAGSGELPSEAIRYCQQMQQPFFVVGFEGHAEQLPLSDIEHEIFHLGSIGKAIKRLRKENISIITLAGKVGRPSLSALKMDFSALKLLKRLSKSRFMGDNFIFTTLIEFLEESGFKIIGVQEVAPALLSPKGVLGKHEVDNRMHDDIAIACHILRTMGDLDVGQGAIVQHGLVLGIEAIEGTDALIKRCGELRKKEPGGVLVKLKKPSQDARIDLPTIGVNTVENIHAAGLKGIAVEAGSSLIVERDAVVKCADELGIVLVGV